MVEEEVVKEFEANDFSPKFKEDVQNDLECLLAIQNLWKDINSDPKIKKLISILKNNKNLKNNKIVMFTESTETGMYLLKELSKEFPNKVLFYSSEGGRLFDKDRLLNLSQKDGRNEIRENFDPNIKNNQKNNIRILISTDVLAEGINLHRSNINLNYDLPWNPTRVIQRIGRVNRVGSQHKNIHVYNFFPSEKSDDEIKQKKNIISKIQAFHDCLGSDAKILTETEEVQTFNLFGSDLYENLNRKEFYEEDDDISNSELKFLKIIRDIRDNNKGLYQKISQMPKKSRSSKKFNTKK